MKKKQQSNFYSKEIKRQRQVNEDYKKVIAFIVVLIIIAALLVMLFLFNGMFVTKDYFQDKTTTTTTEISYDPTIITVSNIFKVDEASYYVMLYDTKDDKNNFLYEGLVVGYTGEEPLYSIDLNNVMNAKYYDKEGKENVAPTKYSEVLVTRPTLMYIKKGKVNKFITDRDEIVKYLAPHSESDEKD